MHTKTIGLIAHTGKRGVVELINSIAEEFERFSISILFEKETARVAGKQRGYPVTELGAMTDLLVVAGGDGSILRVIGQLGEMIKPIFGINVGSLGFLTCASSSNYREAVECIAKDRINFSHRALLEARVTLGDKRTNKMLALNDAVLSRGELSRLVMLSTRVNGEPLTEFNADGLVVATPTGSTAYSLSAGGPILDPESGVFVITPICPHVLTNRSIIVSDTSMIEIEASHPDYPVYLTLDGRRPIHVERGSIVTVRKAKKTLPLASLPDASFFSVFRQKLKWSGRKLSEPPSRGLITSPKIDQVCGASGPKPILQFTALLHQFLRCFDHTSRCLDQVSLLSLARLFPRSLHSPYRVVGACKFLPNSVPFVNTD